MLRRYRKIKGDSRLTATGDRGHHSVCNYHTTKLLSSNSLYLLLSPSISFPLITDPAPIPAPAWVGNLVMASISFTHLPCMGGELG